MVQKNIAVVLGRFHRESVTRMLEEARRAARDAGLVITHEVWVPGSLEKPLALKRLLSRPDIAGAVVLGIIERGETKHGLVMGHAVIDAIIALQLETMKPVGVGIIGPEALPEHIGPRLDSYARKAVDAVAEMLLPE